MTINDSIGRRVQELYGVFMEKQQDIKDGSSPGVGNIAMHWIAPFYCLAGQISVKRQS